MAKLEYQKFRVRSPVKTFRDLDVYKNTTQLAAEIFNLKPPGKSPKIIKETESLYDIAKHIPRLIAESYGNKFDNFLLSQAKLEKASELISDIIAKTDFLIASMSSSNLTVQLAQCLKKYQIQRRKVLNLKNAWRRIHQKYQEYQSQSVPTAKVDK